MYAIRLTHGASTVEIKISPCDSYVTNLCTILQTLALKEPSDSEQQQQQLAFKYSLQHVEKNSQKFYLEASMFGENTNNMFWKEIAKEGDEFVLRNEYERVEAKLKLLREALSEATDGTMSPSTDPEEVETKIAATTPTTTKRGSVLLLNTTLGVGKIIKKSVFELRACLPCFQFAEEFICEGGIKTLLSITRQTTGNTQAYALRALSLALGMYTICCRWMVLDGVGWCWTVLDGVVLC